MVAEAPIVGAVTTNGTLTPGEKRHLGALEKRIERGMSVFREVGEALIEIREKRLYRETHATFDQYIRERWQFERARAYQLMGAAEVARAIPDDLPQPTNEAQVRELVPLVHENPSAVAEIWREVTSSDEPLSQSRVRNAVRAHIPQDDPPPAVSPTTQLVAAIERATTLAIKWLATRPGRADSTRVRKAVADLSEAVGMT